MHSHLLNKDKHRLSAYKPAWAPPTRSPGQGLSSGNTNVNREASTPGPTTRGSVFTGAQFNSHTAGQNNSTPMQLATGTSGESTESTNTSPSSETPTGKGVKLDVASSSTSQTDQSGNSQTNTTDYKEHVPKQNDFFNEVVDGGVTLWKATGNEKCVKVILMRS